MMSQNGNSSSQQAGVQRDEPPLAEWIAAAIGCILVTAVIGYLLYRAIAGDASPPMLAVQQHSIVAAPGGYLVEIRVVNGGASTAADVVVEGEVIKGAEAIEKSEVTIDYVPARSERRAGLFFIADPRQHRLQLRSKGYREP